MGAEVAILDDIVMAGGEGSWKREIGGKRNVEIQREREREREHLLMTGCVCVLKIARLFAAPDMP